MKHHHISKKFSVFLDERVNLYLSNLVRSKLGKNRMPNKHRRDEANGANNEQDGRGNRGRQAVLGKSKRCMKENDSNTSNRVQILIIPYTNNPKSLPLSNRNRVIVGGEPNTHLSDPSKVGKVNQKIQGTHW